MRLAVATLILYFAPRWQVFRSFHSRWWPNEVNPDQLEKNARVMRRRFWASFALVLLVVLLTVLVIRISELLPEVTLKYMLRATAVTVALTATLGRGGWDIQTYMGQTICERIDRSMYNISQLGAVAILLLALAL